MSANLTSRVQEFTPVPDMNLVEREDANAVRVGIVVGGWPVLPLDHHIGQYYVGHHMLIRRQLVPIAGQFCGERDDRGLQDGSLETFNQRLAHNGQVPQYRRYKTAKECAMAINATMQHNAFVVPLSLIGLAQEFSQEIKIGGELVTVRNVDMSKPLAVFNAVMPQDVTSLVEFRNWLLSKKSLGPKGTIAEAKLEKDLKAKALQLHEELTVAANRAFKDLTEYVNGLYADVTKYLRTGVGKQGLDPIEEDLFREIGHALPEHSAADDAARHDMAQSISAGQSNTMSVINALVEQQRLSGEAQAEQSRQFMELAKQNQELLAALTAPKPISDKEQ